jgi:5-methyltetrahydrofolate--homocysteine methyltransferase
MIDFPSQPAAIGANCGAGVLEVLAAITVLRASAPDIRLIAKGSAGLPERRGGHLHYATTPAAMADYAIEALGSGATIVGGCCGTTPEHLAAMRGALNRHTRAAARGSHL